MSDPTTPDVAGALLEILRDLIATVGDGRGLGNLGLDASLERELGLGRLGRGGLRGRGGAPFGLALPGGAGSVASQMVQVIAAAAAGLKAGAMINMDLILADARSAVAATSVSAE